jgi:hypothetical protein
MLRRAALARTDVSEERIASIIRVTTIGELGTKFAVASNRSIIFFRSVLWLLVAVNVVPGLPILITYVPPKRRFFQESHDVKFQKTAFFNNQLCLPTTRNKSNEHRAKGMKIQSLRPHGMNIIAFGPRRRTML